MKGKVKWFNNRRGYGFITTESGEDVFCHYSKFNTENKFFINLEENEEVEFDIETDENGLKQAINIELISRNINI